MMKVSLAQLGLLITVIVAVVMVGSACGAALDLSALSNFLTLRVVNDTSRTVTIEPCPDRHCRPHGHDLVESIAPGQSARIATWLNNMPGLATVRVATTDGGLLGCLRVRYLRGQTNARVRVSTVIRC